MLSTSCYSDVIHSNDARAHPSDDKRPKNLRQKLFETIERNIELKFVSLVWFVALTSGRFDNKLFLNSVTRFVSAFDSYYFEDLRVAKVFTMIFCSHSDLPAVGGVTSTIST